MDLIATPDNPVPPGAVLSEVTTRDGLILRTAHWEPDGATAKGTVCILQGRAEFIEKYFEVVTELRQRGFAVVAFDWRGQGRSARQVSDPYKGHVRSFADYMIDLDAVRAQLLDTLPRPHFGLAHSMGAAIALAAAREGRLPFARLVALTPMIALCMIKRPRFAARLALLLRAFGLGSQYVPGGGATSISKKPFAGNRLTSDERRYARNAVAAAALGEGAIGDPTVAWIDAAFRFMQRFAEPRFPIEVRTPTLVVAAGADPICATPVIERFAARLKAGRAIVLPGARHEILMERDAIRAVFWAAFDAFIPGTPDPVFSASRVEQPERRLVEAGVAGGDD